MRCNVMKHTNNKAPPNLFIRPRDVVMSCKLTLANQRDLVEEIDVCITAIVLALKIKISYKYAITFFQRAPMGKSLNVGSSREGTSKHSGSRSCITCLSWFRCHVSTRDSKVRSRKESRR
jgi:hypothetical protein